MKWRTLFFWKYGTGWLHDAYLLDYERCVKGDLRCWQGGTKTKDWNLIRAEVVSTKGIKLNCKGSIVFIFPTRASVPPAGKWETSFLIWNSAASWKCCLVKRRKMMNQTNNSLIKKMPRAMPDKVPIFAWGFFCCQPSVYSDEVADAGSEEVTGASVLAAEVSSVVVVVVVVVVVSAVK